jgi:arylamine N-acetyltransferase
MSGLSPSPDAWAGYLNRLGLDAEPPSLDALARLQSHHTERVPWETLWIHAGQHRTLDPAASVAAIVDHGHGGYCYHLNGAFAGLLEHLGYRVTRHAGAVRGESGPTQTDAGNHLALLVHDLPTDDHPDGTWYVDVGLGDGPTAPMPLRDGPAEQRGFTFTLRRSPVAGWDWDFVHDPRGASSGMSFVAAPVSMDVFGTQHERLSTAPDSSFVKLLILLRRHPTGSERLIDLDHYRTDERGTEHCVIDTPDEWFALANDVFGRRTDELDDDQRDLLFHLAVRRREARLKDG